MVKCKSEIIVLVFGMGVARQTNHLAYTMTNSIQPVRPLQSHFPCTLHWSDPCRRPILCSFCCCVRIKIEIQMVVPIVCRLFRPKFTPRHARLRLQCRFTTSTCKQTHLTSWQHTTYGELSSMRWRWHRLQELLLLFNFSLQMNCVFCLQNYTFFVNNLVYRNSSEINPRTPNIEIQINVCFLFEKKNPLSLSSPFIRLVNASIILSTS